MHDPLVVLPCRTTGTSNYLHAIIFFIFFFTFNQGLGAGAWLKKQLFYLFYIFFQFCFPSLRGKEYFAKLNQ